MAHFIIVNIILLDYDYGRMKHNYVVGKDGAVFNHFIYYWVA